MLRTQIQFTEQQTRRLRRLSKRQGVSVAEVVRQAVDSLLSQREPDRLASYERAGKLVGAFTDRSAKALSTQHDRYLDEAFR